MAAQSRDEALDWMNKIRETAESASHREDENRKRERALRIARELSNLVVYCRSVVFNHERCVFLFISIDRQEHHVFLRSSTRLLTELGSPVQCRSRLSLRFFLSK
jgi:hypothetical protein